MSLVRSGSAGRAPRSRLVCLVALIALAVAGCDAGQVQAVEQEDEGVQEQGSATVPEDVDDSVVLLGTDDLQWETTELEVAAGVIAFELQCEPRVNHNLVIIETGEEIAACGPGETATGTIELDAGEYTYVCTIPGHSGTMRGSLSVG